jgi:hypothetical protein
MTKTSVVINYCSNEKCFVDSILTQCDKFSDDIVVSYGDRLFDGSPEDEDHISECKAKYPRVNFVKYNVNLALDLNVQKGVQQRPTAFWHNLARWTGINALKRKEWVFLLDADEIPDGDMVKKWIDQASLRTNESYKMANYWYFKYVTNRSTTLEDSVLLIHSIHLTEDNVFGDYERDHLIAASGTILMRQVKGLNNTVLFNHMSWTRSRKALEHKIKNWGHKSEYDADKLIEYIYKDENVNDIVHGYQYEQVPNKFNITLE